MRSLLTPLSVFFLASLSVGLGPCDAVADQKLIPGAACIAVTDGSLATDYDAGTTVVRTGVAGGIALKPGVSNARVVCPLLRDKTQSLNGLAEVRLYIKDTSTRTGINCSLDRRNFQTEEILRTQYQPPASETMDGWVNFATAGPGGSVFNWANQQSSNANAFNPVTTNDTNWSLDCTLRAGVELRAIDYTEE